jgi:diguanylate cyclase (GGDEF)-like protein
VTAPVDPVDARDSPVAAWQTLIAGLPQATWIVDGRSLDVVACNDAAQALFGGTAVTGSRADALLQAPEDVAFWDDVAAGRSGVLDSETTVSVGGLRALHVARSIQPLGTGHYVVTLSDRSAWRAAEDARERTVAELQATLEATADGVLVTDTAGRVRAFNRRFADLWALPADLLEERSEANDVAVHLWLRRCVVDADGYESRLQAVLEAGLASAIDQLHLQSGPVIERVTRPLCQHGRPVGWVYSFRDLSERIAADQRIRQLSHHDVLTGLMNRRELEAAVARASSALGPAGAGFALLLIDLDHFRTINASFGTAVGDRVLAELAQRIRGCLRHGDVAARIGGDQFALLVHRADAAGAEAAARRVLEAVAVPCQFDGAQFTVTCSVGVALSPQHGRGIDELLRHAEAAVRAVKVAGRASWRVSRAGVGTDVRVRMRLDHAMRQALAGDRFRLYFQPQVDMARGVVVGAEALIRWRDREFGDVPPARFIPVAEESGLIVAIGDWVVNQAVRQAAMWVERGFEMPVAVNVSALQFQQPGFVDRVATVLAAHGLDPRWLELELTESILLHDVDDALNRLDALARLGVRLSIDDFGTGYSSLSYLKRFPIAKLKIDRSFVGGLPDDDSDASIVRAIVQMARALSIRVIAEGVETEGQREFLRSAGCDEFQGYLFAPPLDARRFEDRLRRNAGGAAARTPRPRLIAV